MAKAQTNTTPATTAPEGGALVSIQDRIKARIANVDRTTAGMGTQKINLAVTGFTLPNGNQSAGPLNCIVVDYINVNAWYEKAYVKGSIDAPDCTAIAREISEMVPDQSLEKVQAASCESCPKNEWGSKGAGKECRNGIMLAVLPEDFDDSSELLTINVSPKGIKSWSKLVHLLKETGKDPAEIVTSISLVPGLTYPQLEFKALGPNNNLEGLNPFLPLADALLKPTK